MLVRIQPSQLMGGRSIGRSAVISTSSFGSLAQLAEHLAVNQGVVGSSPTGAASKDMAVIRYFSAGLEPPCCLCPIGVIG